MVMGAIVLLNFKSIGSGVKEFEGSNEEVARLETGDLLPDPKIKKLPSVLIAMRRSWMRKTYQGNALSGVRYRVCVKVII